MNCSSMKANGERCRGIAKAGSDYCPAHDPARAAARRQAASKAGRVRAGGELAEVKARLRQIAQDVLEGDIDKGRASIAAQVLGVYLRAVEQERKEQEFLEVRAEMAELREMFETQSGEGVTSWNR